MSQCAICQRSSRRCVCQYLISEPIKFNANLIIIQTQVEKDHPKNTGFFLTQNITSVQRILIRLPSHHQPQESCLKLLHKTIKELEATHTNCLLLYPSKSRIGEMTEPNFISASSDESLDKIKSLTSTEQSQLSLIILDMTWGHSQRFLALCPRIAELPRYFLTKPEIDMFRTQLFNYPFTHNPYTLLRSGLRREHEISTFEAGLFALISLEFIQNSLPIFHQKKVTTLLKQQEIKKWQSLWQIYLDWLNSQATRINLIPKK